MALPARSFSVSLGSRLYRDSATSRSRVRNERAGQARGVGGIRTRMLPLTNIAGRDRTVWRDMAGARGLVRLLLRIER